MNNNKYTRQALQNIPNENKRNEVNNMINQFIDELLRHAGQGRKSYFYNMTNMEFSRNPLVPIVNNVYSVPIDEILVMFRERFPDCIVSYQEILTEGAGGIRSVKKGILIDWA